MQLLIDTREQRPLEFPKMKGVEVLTQGLKVGDYSAIHGEGTPDPTVIERKSIADLFGSFTAGYEQEKAKWTRAKEAGLTYLLAIEGSVSDILAGHCYWKDGELHESRKSGLAMIRQLCTLQRKYGLQVLFFTSRKEAALYLQEYFLAHERVTLDLEAGGRGGSQKEGKGSKDGGEAEVEVKRDPNLSRQ